MSYKYTSLFLSFFYLTYCCGGTEVLETSHEVNFHAISSSFTPERKRPLVEDGEDKENLFQTPLKKSLKFAKGEEISPNCQSKKKDGCLDPRVLKNSLNYAYGEAAFNDQCDAWHEEHLKILEEIMGKNSRSLHKKNIALAGLHFVYEHEGKILFSKNLDLDILFLSGKKRSNLVLRTSSLKKRTLKAKTIYDFFAADYTGKGVTQKMRADLQQYFLAEAPTKLNPQSFLARHKECLSPQKTTPLAGKKIAVRSDSFFQQHYFHSEQVLLLYLTRQISLLAPLLQEIPAGATFHQLTLQIASRNQMCRHCGATYYRLSEGAGPFESILLDYIKNFPHKHFNLKENKVDIFAQVSGIKTFDGVHIEHRTKQVQNAGELINVPSFLPHVAQKCLPNQLNQTQKKKNEDQKQKKITDFKEFRMLDDGSDDDSDHGGDPYSD